MNVSRVQRPICQKCQFSGRFKRFYASSSVPIERLLIANRGEIACRIIKTAQKLGIKTVGVYSEVDRHALHVDMADEAYFIGPAPSQQSYLSADKIIQTAHQTKSQAIHPGYGFLSENAEFADRCAQENLIFVGPPASAIRDMGLKNRAKSLMHDARVPIIEGYHGSDQSDEILKTEAKRIGFPVMLKAVRGGGGKGMRIVKTESDFDQQLSSARHESTKAFGDCAMIVEKFVEHPRHVEVQIFGDAHDNYVYLFERDCSVQRRHQKIIEEAPAPKISQETRRKIGQAARQAAAAVKYVGAGTVEFIMDKNEKFYFMEMNTRLQVEHPVTEMITGFDLVEWQLRVAAGEELPVKDQNQLKINGHSFETRIYAEDPEDNFMPGAGFIPYLKVGDQIINDKNVRVETGIREADSVSVHYDPMIAKLVVWAPDRLQALGKLAHVLKEYQIAGMKTNIPFLQRLIKNEHFRQGLVHTDFIPEHQNELFPKKDKKQIHIDQMAKMVVGKILLGREIDQENCQENAKDPFDIKDHFRVNLNRTKVESLIIGQNRLDINVEYCNYNQYIINPIGSADQMRCKVIKTDFDTNSNRSVLKISLELGSNIQKYQIVKIGTNFTLFDNGQDRLIEFGEWKPEFLAELEKSSGSNTSGDSTAPMPGIIEKILVKSGQELEINDPLVVMVAMKMEYVVRASKKCKIQAILCKVGDNVAKGAHLVSFEQ